MNYLIYDSNNSIHLKDYVLYLVNDIKRDENEFYYFELNKLIVDHLYKKLNFKELLERNIIINSISSESQSLFDKCFNPFFKSIREERYIDRFVKEKKIDHVFFLQIDIYQLILGLRIFFFRKKTKISGILLTPYFIYPHFEKIKKIKKLFQTSLIVLNNEVSKIFILNDEETALNLNKKFKTKIFKNLPDPISSLKLKRKKYSNLLDLKKDKITFSILGNISKRKNLINVIQAFHLLKNDKLDNFQLLICGKFIDKAYKKHVYETIKDLRNIIIIDKFCDDEELEYIISISDIIFTLYINFYASSGFLGLATKYKKLVISSNFGIISKIVSKFKLGLLANPFDSFSIGDAIKKSIENKKKLFDNAGFNQYLNQNSETLFTSLILQSLKEKNDYK